MEDQEKKSKCHMTQDGKLQCEKQDGNITDQTWTELPGLGKMPEHGITCDMRMKEESDGMSMSYTCRPLKPRTKKDPSTGGETE